MELGLPIPHLKTFSHHACTCRRFAMDEFGDHLHCCTQHAGATTGAHEHILTAVQRLFTTAGYKTDRKHVPHSRGLKKADLVVKDFRLAGIRDLIIDVSLRHEFHGACTDPVRNGEASHADANSALDAAVKAKLDNYQHDYNEHNFFFLLVRVGRQVVRGWTFGRSQRQRQTLIHRAILCLSQPCSASGARWLASSTTTGANLQCGRTLAGGARERSWSQSRITRARPHTRKLQTCR